jgi:hypothetical protein
MADKAIVAVYSPPSLPLPYLAVVIHPDGLVSGGAVTTVAEAQTMANELASELQLEMVKP